MLYALFDWLDSYIPALNVFHYLLDETAGATDEWSPAGDALLIGKRTGFALYRDGERKVLIGVGATTVIPLTNNKATLSSFFTNAKIGGGTPGHLGTAWASYLLSPDWSTVWPASSSFSVTLIPRISTPRSSTQQWVPEFQSK